MKSDNKSDTRKDPLADCDYNKGNCLNPIDVEFLTVLIISMFKYYNNLHFDASNLKHLYRGLKPVSIIIKV
jgi:hypothetical protein